MDATLEKSLINCWREAAKGVISREETAEMVVPDTLPDIAEIIDADGVILIRGKEAMKGAVSVTAEILATVLFLPEGGGGPCRLSLKMPWSCRLEVDEADEKCVPMAVLSLTSVDARALNPRKVLVRADLTAALSCYRQARLELPCTVQSEKRVETLMESCAISPVTAVREKTFAVVDEYAVPSSRPAIGSILKYRVDLQVEDIKPVGSKLVFKGVARTEILYADVEFGEPVSASFHTAFSQIIEMDTPCEGANHEIMLLLTGAYIEQLSPTEQCRGIKAELHLAAQAVLRQEMDAEYICDAYCNCAKANVETESLTVEHLERYAELRETVRELMETPEPVREVISICALASRASAQENAVGCTVNLNAVYRSEGGTLSSVSRSYAVESALQLSPQLQARVLSVNCPESFATPAAGGIEVRVPVDLRVALTEMRELRPVSSVEFIEDNVCAQERPSLVIRRATETDSLWSLAKNGCSTMELIRQVNALESESVPAGRVLLIPKAR